MNKFIIHCICALLFCSFGLYAQTFEFVPPTPVSYYEYWFGDDFAGRKTIELGSNADLTLQLMKLNVSGLSKGAHRLHYRAHNENGDWTPVYSRQFMVPATAATIEPPSPVSHYEYWFGDDFAARKNVAFKNVDDLFQHLMKLDVSGQDEGIHVFYYRAMCGNGQWTPVYTRKFYVRPPKSDTGENLITGYRYWIDEALVSEVTLDEPASPFHLEGGVPLPDDLEAETSYMFMIQFVNSNNHWTHPTFQEFEYLSPLSGALTVKLPEEGLSTYQDMTLSLVSLKNETRYSLTVGADSGYTFDDIPYGRYSLSLTNRFDDVLGFLDELFINSEAQEISFTNLQKSSVVSIFLRDESGQFLQTAPVAEWRNDEGTLLHTGDRFSGLAPGTTLTYRILFDVSLGLRYVLPAAGEHIIAAGDNFIVVTLRDIPVVTVTGLVRDELSGALPFATITVSQMLNGAFPVSSTARADKDGRFSVSLFNDSTVMTVSQTGYHSKTVGASRFNGAAADVGAISLSQVSGTVISLELSGTASAPAGQTAVAGSWSVDWRNVAYTLFNVTKDQEISGFQVQNLEIVVFDTADAGDRIRVVAASRTGEFEPVECTVTVSEKYRAVAPINITQRGSVSISVVSAPSFPAVAIFYNSSGELIACYPYRNGAVATPPLPDGFYILVSMAQSDYFNSVMQLSDFNSVGLAFYRDYLMESVMVKSGEITEIQIASIPQLDEANRLYTGSRTVYSVEKTQIPAGSFQTFRAEIDFNEAYFSDVSNLRLIADIPANCEFIGSGVLVGNQLVQDFEMVKNSVDLGEGNQIIIDLPDPETWNLDPETGNPEPGTLNSMVVRFCLVPVQTGNFSPGAYVEFDLNGETVRQPIGAARFTVMEMSIFAPSVTSQPEITVHGVGSAHSEVQVFDGDLLIGQTRAAANGIWSLSCGLHQAQAVSVHYLHAKVKTASGNVFSTETKEVRHVSTTITVSKVLMYNTSQVVQEMDYCEYVTEFDFLNPDKEGGIYWYWHDLPNFTFTISFTQNDPALVSNVRLSVFTTSGGTVSLPAVYDAPKNLWVASGEFDVSSLPVNVNVDYTVNTGTLFDSDHTQAFAGEITNFMERMQQEEPLYQATPPTTETPESVIKNLLDMSEEKFNERIDGSILEVDGIIGKSEALDAELLQSSRNYSLYAPREVTLSDGRTATIFSTSCDDLSETDFQNGEYSQIPTTTGRYIYVKSSDDEYVLVDFDRNLYRTIRIETQMMQMERTGAELIREKQSVPFNPRPMIGQILSELTVKLKTDQDDYVDASSTYDAEVKNFNRKDQDMADEHTVIARKMETAPEEQQTELQIIRRYVETKREELTQALNQYLKYGEFLRKIPEYLSLAINVKQAYEDALKNCDRIDRLALSIPEAADESEKENLQKNIDIVRTAMTNEYSGDVCNVVGFLHSENLSSPSSVATLALVISEAQYTSDRASRFNYLVDNMIKAIENDLVAIESKYGGVATSGFAVPGPCPPAQCNLDPSGYVYEAVPSNRLKGVSVSIYRKAEEGNGVPVGTSILWNAADYAQLNPFVTNDYGMYSWSVPKGEWQMKYECNGYQTVYSDWLNIPPPQLELNVGLVQTTQPSVKAAFGYEEAIRIEFDKFMQTVTLTTDMITVTRNGDPENGRIVYLNEEENPENANETFVSGILFEPQTPFSIGDVVELTVKRAVKSYTGISMAADYRQTIAIQRRPERLSVPGELSVMLHNHSNIVVEAFPNTALAGKTVTAHSVSPDIVSVTEKVKLDGEGKAILQVKGELPGATVIYVSVDETELRGSVTVRVSIPQPLLTVDRETIAFGATLTGTKADARTVTVAGTYIAGSIRYRITGADANAFSIAERSWSASTGGSLNVMFYPEEKRVYNATLEISSQDTPARQISLSGTGIDDGPQIPVSSVSLAASELSMIVGDKKTLSATVHPAGATNKTVQWSSADASVASVINGEVTAIKAGMTIIIVTADDGNKMTFCTVTVSNPVISVSSVSLDPPSLSMIAGETKTLTATILPETATDKILGWSSSDPNVADVFNGVVVAFKSGAATITVTANDGGKTANCAVTVANAAVPVTGITLNKTNLNLPVGASETLTATVAPDNATNPTVQWTSANATVANVDDGLITALKAGSATIIASASDGGKFAYCTVTVSPLTNSEITDAPLARVFPNPTDGIFTLEFEAEDVYNLTLADMTGKILLRQTVKGQRVQMDLSNYPAGTYLLTIDDGKWQNTMRVVKN